MTRVNVYQPHGCGGKPIKVEMATCPDCHGTRLITKVRVDGHRHLAPCYRCERRRQRCQV